MLLNHGSENQLEATTAGAHIKFFFESQTARKGNISLRFSFNKIEPKREKEKVLIKKLHV